VAVFSGIHCGRLLHHDFSGSVCGRSARYDSIRLCVALFSGTPHGCLPQSDSLLRDVLRWQSLWLLASLLQHSSMCLALFSVIPRGCLAHHAGIHPCVAVFRGIPCGCLLHRDNHRLCVIEFSGSVCGIPCRCLPHPDSLHPCVTLVKTNCPPAADCHGLHHCPARVFLLQRIQNSALH